MADGCHFENGSIALSHATYGNVLLSNISFYDICRFTWVI